jgi:DNA-binding response OmpR family regulator
MKVEAPASRDVLLIEDDDRLARALALALGDAGNDVRVASTARQAHLRWAEREPDVILLDLGLPDGDGLELCAELRARSDVPIIMVTARSDSADVVAGLEAGADDYVSKPVVGSELSARIRALLRRTEREAPAGSVTAGSLVIDLRHGSVRRDDHEIALTRTERRLLRELAAHAGQVVTREELLERVWGYQDIGDSRLLDVHIRRLRTKVEQDPSTPERVVTVRGLGYRFQT